jgi:hypothetical protein
VLPFGDMLGDGVVVTVSGAVRLKKCEIDSQVCEFVWHFVGTRRSACIIMSPQRFFQTQVFFFPKKVCCAITITPWTIRMASRHSFRFVLFCFRDLPTVCLLCSNNVKDLQHAAFLLFLFLSFETNLGCRRATVPQKM